MSDVRLTIMVAALVVAGCSDSAGPTAASGLVSTLSLDKPYVSTTDPVGVTITTRNPTRNPIGFFSRCSGPVFRVFQDGNPVNPGSCPIPEYEYIEIAPGDSLVSRSGWGILYYDVDVGARIALRAGRYQLVGGIDVDGKLLARSAPVSVEAQVP